MTQTLTELSRCSTCQRETRWLYRDECWSCAKKRLAEEDDTVPIAIDVRVVLEGDVDPDVEPIS